jgi:hypothetical protein
MCRLVYLYVFCCSEMLIADTPIALFAQVSCCSQNSESCLHNVQLCNSTTGGSNPCGQSPMDFESISLAARTQCLVIPRQLSDTCYAQPRATAMKRSGKRGCVTTATSYEGMPVALDAHRHASNKQTKLILLSCENNQKYSHLWD